MGEIALKELTLAIIEGREPKKEYWQLPSHAECLKNREQYIDLFDT
jgi:hypothetical protein